MSLGASRCDGFVPMIIQEVLDSQVMDLLSFCLRNEARRICCTVRCVSAFVEIAASGDSDH
jgi:hypothetical protein